MVQKQKFYVTIKHMKEKRKKFIQCVHNSNKEVSPFETIHAIKNAGFDGVFLQWFNKDWDFSQEEQLKLCLSLGLEIPFVHLGYKGINSIWEEGEEGDRLVENYFADFEVCKKYGIDMLVMHLTSKTEAKEPNPIGLERIKKLVKLAEKLGLKIAFENTKIWGYLEYVFENIKSDNIGVCFDIGHCHAHFDDKFSWDMFKNKIIAVHLHDNDKSADQHLLPFDGTIDWEYFTQKLKQANYSGVVALENCYRRNYLEMSLEEFYKLSLERAKQLNI